MPNRTARRSNARMQESARQSQKVEHPNRRKAEPNRSSIGNLDVRTIAPFCYIATIVIGFVPKLGYGAFVFPLAVFLIETRSAFVRFHALQAAIFHIATIVVMMPMALAAKWVQANLLWRIGSAPSLMLALLLLALMATVGIGAVVFLYKATWSARREEVYRMPVIGSLAERVADILGRSVGR